MSSRLSMVSALGGITVEIKDNDYEDARAILNSIEESQNQEPDQEQQASLLQDPEKLARRSSAAAIFGLFILPIIGNVYSVYLALEIYDTFWKNAVIRRHLLIAFSFNLISFSLWGFLIFS